MSYRRVQRYIDYTKGMRVKITYYQGGSTWSEVITANNVNHAREIASNRNPDIKIISSNPVFDS